MDQLSGTGTILFLFICLVIIAVFGLGGCLIGWLLF